MTGLTFTCEGCGETHSIESPEDDMPDVLVKIRRVERACRACGHVAEGLGAPTQCRNEGCPDPDRGFGSAERVVTRAVEVALCSACQDGVDAGAIADAL